MNQLNSLLNDKNLALESSVQEIINRLNTSIDNSDNLRTQIIELSESIEELNYIEVDDFIETIRNIDDN